VQGTISALTTHNAGEACATDELIQANPLEWNTARASAADSSAAKIEAPDTNSFKARHR
jgi:hypothetical protein